MIRKGNLTIGLQTRFAPRWTGIFFGARTMQQQIWLLLILILFAGILQSFAF